MVDFINSTGYIGIILNNTNQYITGSETLTFLLIIIGFIALMSLGRLPLQFQSLFLMPLIIVLMAYNSSFMIIGSIFLFFISLMMAKFWFF